MTRRFVVIVRNSTPAQQNVVTRYLQSKGYGFFHWVPETWLVTTNAGETVATLRDTIRTLVPVLQIVVLFVAQGGAPNWAVFGPAGWSEWFRINWDAEI